MKRDREEDVYGGYGRRRPREPSPRGRFPRQDKAFANSVIEERRAMGDYDRDYPDPYKVNRKIDFRRLEVIENPCNIMIIEVIMKGSFRKIIRISIYQVHILKEC